MRIACDCHNTLGRLVEAVYLVQHRGRGVAAGVLLTVTCEACGKRHVLRAPGPLDEALRERVACGDCGNTLGSRCGAIWLFQHRGRRWLMRDVALLHCEDCGHSQPGDAPVPTPAAA